MSIDFSSSRLSYEQGELQETDLPKVPYPLLDTWVKQAVSAQTNEAYAFFLATCGADNQPSVRTLLMREIKPLAQDNIGLVFYSNYKSAKGIDLANNPKAEALFFWANLERQVRLTGKVNKLEPTQSAQYFHSRPRDSQLGAWVSQPQSGVVANRDIMQATFDDFSTRFAGQDVPKPDFWGGYQLNVERIEFWQGRANRMHDRIVYQLTDKGWQIARLLP